MKQVFKVIVESASGVNSLVLKEELESILLQYIFKSKILKKTKLEYINVEYFGVRK